MVSRSCPLQVRVFLQDVTLMLSLLLLTGSVHASLSGNGTAARKTLTLHLERSRGTMYPRKILTSFRECQTEHGCSVVERTVLERIHQPGVPLYNIGNPTAQIISENDVIFSETGASYKSQDGAVLVLLEASQDWTVSHYIVAGVLLYQGTEYTISPETVTLKSKLGGTDVEVDLQLVLPRFEPVSHSYVVSEKSTLSSIKKAIIQVPHHRRRRRSVTFPTTFTVSVLAVVDYSVYSKWRSKKSEDKTKQDILRYYRHVFIGVDERFRNIDFSEFQLRVKLAGLIILTDDGMYPWTINKTPENSGKIRAEAGTVLGNFRDWVNDTSGLPPHDHAILFTGYDLFSKRADSDEEISHTSGLAFIGTLCGTGDSASIVEEPGGFQGIGTTTHEISHSLGALHDGENNTCSSMDRYIMAASGFGPVPDSKKLNPWHFSSCSIEYFRSFITTQLADGSTCLLDSEPEETGPTVPGQLPVRTLPGQQYSPDEQCRMIWGPGSYMCRGSEFGTATTICTAMYCRDPASNNDCVLHTAARGSSCGNKQWCINGKCVFDEQAPIKAESCVHGDQPGVAFNGMSCARLVSESSSYCYQDKVRARCCESCGNQRTYVQGCEYGDRVHGCKSWHCDADVGNTGSGVLRDCCHTCRVGVVNIPRATQVPVAFRTTEQSFHVRVEDVGCNDVYGDVTCRNYVILHGQHVCYSRKVADRCCKTCQSLKSEAKGCEFGDRTPQLCSRIANLTELICSVHGQHCCFSCQHKFEPHLMSSASCNDHLQLPVLTTGIMVLLRFLYLYQLS